MPTKCSYSWKAEDDLLCIAVRRFFNEEYSPILFQEVGYVWFNAVLVDLISRYWAAAGEGKERELGESLVYLLKSKCNFVVTLRQSNCHPLAPFCLTLVTMWQLKYNNNFLKSQIGELNWLTAQLHAPWCWHVEKSESGQGYLRGWRQPVVGLT